MVAVLRNWRVISECNSNVPFITGLSYSWIVPLYVAKCLVKKAEYIVDNEDYSGRPIASNQKCLWSLGSTIFEPAEGFIPATIWVILMSFKVSLPLSYQCS